ncbi:Ig-like domain-containing protein [Enterobacter sp. JBIWA003]|uniref:invasin domain 3-containing protein n=1 Tax=Enterobacter sp. JBIWA003 TaxID=2831890 RepID=UPI001CBF398F|nr:invasin domain 3-containing protein [Enterobacter sp. JBIWA003]UAN21467.1 Ig-like domain-containing protein [Enterobacter sp. JBIWA003]
MGADDRAGAARSAALGRINGMANGVMNNAIRDWLGQKGNARVQIDTEKRGSADLLVPLVDAQEHLIYGQAGVRRDRDRTIWNGGLGVRYYPAEEFMLGVNSFYDYDQTGNNARYGVGLEARTDYISLSANRYFRITDWHQSVLDSMRDYDERPANGYDLRARYWLPAYPQVGGEFTYEKYFGKGIASGTGSASPDSLRDAPQTFTTAVNYTPFPLMTVTAGHRSGDSSDLFARIDFNWRFGLSLSEQLSADNVSIMRSLKGGRYDLVDRNYNIVMQYRKQELVSLSLPPSFEGEALTSIPVTAKAKAKYGVSRVEWEAGAFIAAGGQIVTGANPLEVSLVLPAWNSPETGKENTYTLTAVMTDREGNKAEARTVITVKASSVQATLSVVSDNALADGRSANQVVVKVTDASGKPVSGMALKVIISPSTGKNECTINGSSDCGGFAATTDASGQVALNITHLRAGQYALSTTLINGNSFVTGVTFVPVNASVTGMTLLATSPVTAGQSSMLTLKVVNRDSAPVTGLQSSDIVLSNTLTGQDYSGIVWTDNGDGSYSASVVMTSAGINTLKANIPASNIAADASVSVTAGAPDAARSSLAAAPATIAADGVAASTLTLTLRDALNNPVSGQAVAFASTLGGVTFSTVTDNGDGSYTATLTGTTAGAAAVSATLGGAAFGVAPAGVTLTAGAPDAARSSLAAAPATIAADGVAASTLTLTLRDALNNPVSGQAVAFASTLGGVTFSTVTDNGDGSYTATLTGTTAGAAAVSATLGGAAFGVAPAGVTLTAGAPDAARSSLAAAPATIAADGVAASTLTLTLRDALNNPVSGQAVAFASTLGGVTFSTVTDNGDGSYTATLTGTTAGAAAVSATLGGAAFGVAPAGVTLTAGAPDAARSSLAAAPATIAADGVAASTLTLTLRDALNNPVSGQAVAFASTLGGVTFSTVTDNGDGSYTATLTGTTAGAAAVSATLGGAAFGVAPAGVTLTAGAPDAARSSLAAAPATIAADGVAASTLTLTLRDALNNPVSGQAVAFASTLGGVTFSTVTDNGDGSYTATLTGTTAGAAAVSATLGGAAFGVAPAGVTLTAGAPDAARSSLAAAPATIAADGVAASTLTLTLRDALNNPVSGQAVAFASTLGGVTFSTVTDNGDGSYTATLTGTTAGAAAVSATLGGAAFGVAPAGVTLTAGAPDAARSSLAAAPATIAADGVAASTLTLTLRDALNNPVSGQAVAFASTLGGVTFSTVTDNGDGSYTATLTGTTAGAAAVSATLGGAAFGVAPAGVTLTAGAPDAARSSLAAAPATIAADGVAASTLTLTLRDALNNPVSGQAVAFASTLGGVTFSTVTDNGDGSYTATLTGTTAGAAAVSATLGGAAFGVAPAGVTLTAGAPDAARSSLAAAPATIAADGVAASTLTLTLRDALNNPVSGQAVAFASTLGGVTFSTVTDNGDGSYTATLTGTTAGAAAVSATLGGAAFGVAPAGVTLTAGAPDAARSSLAAAPATIVADGVAASTLTLTLRDALNNPVSGQAVAFASTLGGVTFSTVTDNGDGSYTATLTGTTAGAAAVSATLGGAAFGVAPAGVTLTGEITGVTAGGFTFATTAGFPTTGFNNASFTINTVGAAAGYNWTSSDTSWVSVSSTGRVTFTAEGTTSPVTITATPIAGGDALTYTFTVNKWFINNGATRLTGNNARDWCIGRALNLPVLSDMTVNNSNIATGVRGIGALWNEWGALAVYPGSGFTNGSYWSAQALNVSTWYEASMGSGIVYTGSIVAVDYVMCSKYL